MKKIFTYTILTLCIAMIAGFTMSGCTDSQRANFSSLGSSGIITLYGCDGKIINQWKSTGKISTVTNSDGWEFKDEKTGKFIRVSGTVVIEN